MLRLTHVTQLDQGVANMCFQAWQNVEHLWYNEGKSAARWKCYQHPNAPDPTQGVRPMSSFPDSTPSDDTITIPLTRGYETIIDAVDADLAEFSWYTMVPKVSRTLYARRSFRVEGQVHTMSMHRAVMARALGRSIDPHEQVDHINGNGLDNRRCNLRICNRFQNQANSKRHKNNKSGFKGVSPARSRFQASIMVGRVRHKLGTFDTPEEAYEAYCEAAKRLHGEFARFE